MENQYTARSIGRRDVIKKTAVVAAAGWAAPTVVSSRASATNGGTCPPADGCNTYYVVKIDGGGCQDNPDISVPGFNCPGNGNNNKDCVPCQPTYEQLLDQFGVVTVKAAACPTSPIMLEQVANPANSYLKIKLAPGSKLTFALRKTGAGCPDGGAWSPDVTSCDSSGTTYIWNSKSFSNATIVICGPPMPSSSHDARTAIYDPEEAASRSFLEEPSEGELRTTTAGAGTSEVTTTTEAPAPATTEAPATTTTEAPAPATTEATTTTTEAPATTTTEATTTTTEAPVTTEVPTETSVVESSGGEGAAGGESASGGEAAGGDTATRND